MPEHARLPPGPPSAPLAAGLLIVSWGVVDASGSRTLGGVVLLTGGLALGGLWRSRRGTRVAAQLLGAGFAAFVASHLVALALGAWPAVLIAAAAMAALTWRLADSPAHTLAADSPRPQRRVRAIRRPAR